MSKKVEFSEKTKEAFKNKAFVRELLTLETGKEVRDKLKEKGIVLTADELDKFAEVLVLALEKGEEITDSDLENVVGGVASVSNNMSFLISTTKEIGGLVENGYFAKRREFIKKHCDFSF